LKRLFYEAGDECEKMETNNKKIKQDLEAFQAEHQQVKSANEKLMTENSRLQRELEQATNDKIKRAQEYVALSESLATAEKKAEEADTRALLKFANDQKQHAVQIQEWKAKSVKAEAEKNQEKAAAQDYKNKLDAMAAELEKMEKERIRADEAETKLASIQALVRKTA
jgi:chromosome segregation ATPase